jgi:hypothetical protein
MGFSLARGAEGEWRQGGREAGRHFVVWQNHHFGVLEKAGEVAGAQEIGESPNG